MTKATLLYAIETAASTTSLDHLAMLYAQLIVSGDMTFADVPDNLKDRVRAILIAAGFPELAQ